MKQFEIDIYSGFHKWIRDKNYLTPVSYEKLNFCSYSRLVMWTLFWELAKLGLKTALYGGATFAVLGLMHMLGEQMAKDLGLSFGDGYWSYVLLTGTGILGVIIIFSLICAALGVVFGLVPWLIKQAWRMYKNRTKEEKAPSPPSFISEVIRTRFSKYCIKLKVKE